MGVARERSLEPLLETDPEIVKPVPELCSRGEFIRVTCWQRSNAP